MTTPRRKMDIGAIALGFTMLCQLAAITWGAAKFDSALDQLQSITTKLEASNASRDQILANYGERIRVLEIKRDADDRHTAEQDRIIQEMRNR